MNKMLVKNNSKRKPPGWCYNSGSVSGAGSTGGVVGQTTKNVPAGRTTFLYVIHTPSTMAVTMYPKSPVCGRLSMVLSPAGSTG